MAVRTTMATLITRTRDLIQDPAGGSAVFTDQQVQDALDRFRTDYNYVPLDEAQTIAPGGAVSYLKFYAPGGDWEDDAKVYSTSFADITSSATADYLTGLWTFATTQLIPVMLVGKQFDLFRAAAYLLRQWAASKKLKVNFSADGQTVSAGDFKKQLLDMAEEYARSGRPRNLRARRSDVSRYA